MKKMRVLSIFLIVLVNSICRAQQQTVSCPVTIEYGNRNQVDPSRSTISALKGRVIGEVGTPAKNIGPVPACVGLFTENDHRLVVSTTANEEGKFEFKSISAGLYRLVVRDPQNAFCVANIPLRIVRSQRGKPLVIHLRPSGIDDCSYGGFK